MPRPNAKLLFHSTMAPSPLVLQFRLPPRAMHLSATISRAQIDWWENALVALAFGKELAEHWMLMMTP